MNEIFLSSMPASLLLEPEDNTLAIVAASPAALDDHITAIESAQRTHYTFIPGNFRRVEVKTNGFTAPTFTLSLSTFTGNEVPRLVGLHLPQRIDKAQGLLTVGNHLPRNYCRACLKLGNIDNSNHQRRISFTLECSYNQAQRI